MKKNKSPKKSNNKVLLVLLGILLICFCVIGYEFYKYFYAGTGETKYGDRLDGLEKYKLSDTLTEDIKAIYMDNKSVGEISTEVQGKIIYIMIDFVANTKVSDAKNIAIKSLDLIGEENLPYYEVQYILTSSYEKTSCKLSIRTLWVTGVNIIFLLPPTLTVGESSDANSGYWASSPRSSLCKVSYSKSLISGSSWL